MNLKKSAEAVRQAKLRNLREKTHESAVALQKAQHLHSQLKIEMIKEVKCA